LVLFYFMNKVKIKLIKKKNKKNKFIKNLLKNNNNKNKIIKSVVI